MRKQRNQQKQHTGQRGNGGERYRSRDFSNYGSEYGARSFGGPGWERDQPYQGRHDFGDSGSERGDDRMSSRDWSGQQRDDRPSPRGRDQGDDLIYDERERYGTRRPEYGWSAQQGSEFGRYGGKHYAQPRFGSYYGSELGEHRGYRDQVRRARMGSTPRGYTRSDERIREDVCDALMLSGEFEGCDIEVQVKDGEVTLSGTVPERRLKLFVEELSDRVLGVKDVTNSLRVQSDQARDEPSTSRASARTASGNAGERMPNASRA